MPFAIQATLETVQGYLNRSGYFAAGTRIGEPKAPPVAGSNALYAAVYMRHVAVAELNLRATHELHTVQVRIYRDMLAEPTEQAETQMAKVVSQVMSDLLGDLDLGATIRNIDAGGQYGAKLEATWGYVEVGGMLYRVVDITLPLIIDDSATLVA
jgi:hypothetical protein